ncbi:hypothetical protein [Nocardia colli]|uniref:hypothetical protein n=1 Tax=Nocardia colli TaxID=2545717 RepID=UPI00168D0405|nr:hypothetical protein [Nocardia colli]
MRIQEFEGGLIEYFDYADDEVDADGDNGRRVIGSGGDASDDDGVGVGGQEAS